MIKDSKYDYLLQRRLWTVKQAVDLVVRSGKFAAGSILDGILLRGDGGVTITWATEESKERLAYGSRRKVIKEALLDLVRDAMDLGALKPVAPSEKQEKFKDRRVRPTHFLRWVKGKGFQIPEKLRPLLESGEPECEQQEPASSCIPLATVSASCSPRDLHVIVDDVNEQVWVTAQKGKGKRRSYSRTDVVGRGTVTWDLLVDFAKCGGSLEGNTAVDVKKRNTSANRTNLGTKLTEILSLDQSPFVEGRNGVMRFASITIAGGWSASDALGRNKVSFDDQATYFLERHGLDMPVD